MPAHLSGRTTVPGFPDGGGWWLALEPVARAFAWKVTRLGAGIGVCPDEDTCIPIDPVSVRHEGGTTQIRFTDDLLEALGLAAAADTRHLVIRESGPPGAVTQRSGALHDVRLPEARTAERRGLAEPGHRTALYVWASW